MRNIGLIGSESFHTEKFAPILRDAGINIAGIWGEPGREERTRQLSGQYDIEIVGNYTDLIDRADAVMILTRDGGGHLDLALPFIRAGIPVWIDKPIAMPSADAQKLYDETQKYNIPVIGGSTLKHCGDILALKACIDAAQHVDYLSYCYCESLQNPYGGAAFYGIHLCELAYLWCGGDIATVSANVTGSTLNITLHYRNGTIVNPVMTKDAYDMTYMMYAGGKAYAGTFNTDDCYQKGIRNLMEVLSGTAASMTVDEIVIPVKIMELIELSMKNGGTELPFM